MTSSESSRSAHTLIRKILLGAGAIACASLVQMPTALAADDELVEVIVTGSRLARTDSETPSPVQILSAADLQQSGLTSVSEILRTLTANGQGTLSNAFPGAFAGSATGVSLRGLNVSATLVLIDGHRMAPFPLGDDSQREFVDVSSIPFDAVERVEVLKDGASAAYGSDAMAGVVNVILKKSFTGAKISAEGGSTYAGGGETAHFSASYGMGDLDSDGYNAFLNLEYRSQEEILQSDRAGRGLWSSVDLRPIGGISQIAGTINSGAPVPPALGTVYLQGPGTYSAATSKFYATAINGANPDYLGTCTFALQAADGCAFSNPVAELQPATQNINALASFTTKFGDNWALNVKGSVFQSKGEQQSVTSTANGLVVYPTAFSPLVTVSATAPLRLVGTTIASVTVPATYPGNTLGAPARIRGVIPDAPSRHTDYLSRSYRFVADLNGDFLGWSTDFSAGYTKVTTDRDLYGYPNTPALFAALNRPTNPWLVTGGNSAADINAVFPVNSVTDTSSLYFAEGSIAKRFGNLPGGQAGFVLGAQYIKHEVDSPAPVNCATGVTNCNFYFAAGTQDDKAAFAELDLPVLTWLEFNGKVRYDKVEANSATTPSVGFKLKPTEAFAIRGTYGKGFRAPNVAESVQSGASFSAGTISDPILCASGNPATVGVVIARCNYNPTYLQVANPDLKPEKSTSYTAGIIFEPIPEWFTTVDYYQVEVKNQIVTTTPSLNLAVRGDPITETCRGPGGTTVGCTTSVGPILYVPVLFQNANSTEVKGVEFTTRYKLQLGELGSLTTSFDVSHQISYILTTEGVPAQLAGTHGPGIIGGNTGNPKDRAQLTFSFDTQALNVSATMNYVGHFSILDPAQGITECADAAQAGGYFQAWFAGGTAPLQESYCRVASFLTTDLTAKYDLSDQWTLKAGVLNVFDKQPPLDIFTYGGGNLPYNPSMHQAGAVGRFMSFGFSYKFF